MRIIDLSVLVSKNNSEPLGIKQSRKTHNEGAKLISNKTGLPIDVFPNHEYLSLDIFELPTHAGTHIDSPFHYGKTISGKEQKKVAELPLDWFFGDGKVLDVSFVEQGGEITKNDIEQSLNSLENKINRSDIVLLYTGMAKLFGTGEYFSNSTGVSREAIKFLTDLGIKVIGIDSYGFDRSITKMISDYERTGDKEVLWPSHFYGREVEYIQIERLCNLDLLLKEKKEFKVSCFPIKLDDADASWVRAVAII